MSRSLFLRIQFKVETYEPYFIQKRDNAQRLVLSSLQKITVALRMLAYRVAAGFMDGMCGLENPLQSLVVCLWERKVGWFVG